MIRISDLVIGPEERTALNRVIDRAWINEGPEVRAFEEEYADWLGVRHVVAVSSGTAALVCGLTAMKIDPRWDVQKVAIPALTFIATANAVVQCGLEPVFGDVSVLDTCMEPEMSGEFDLLLPVHLCGFAAKVHLLREHHPNVPIVEDACEAHGTYLPTCMAGAYGLWSATSFHVAHTMQAGELGAFCTNDSALANTVRRLKAHGRECACVVCTRNTTGCPIMDAHGYDPRFRCLYPGFNFKPMEFPAALARVQLSKIEKNISRRQENVWRLNELLWGMEELYIPLFTNQEVPMVYPLVVTVPDTRDRITAELSARGIETRPLFGCIPNQQPAYAQYAGSFPNADYLGANGFYVGCHQYLTDEDIETIARTIKDVMRDVH